jgi:hypothetical protein
VFRVFERGGRIAGNTFPETGQPNASGQLQKLEEPGRPDLRQSNRGPGTGARIAVPVLNIHKTRLNDPLMWFLGTNDQPGDYRSSGCTACHVVYAIAMCAIPDPMPHSVTTGRPRAPIRPFRATSAVIRSSTSSLAPCLRASA